MRTTHLPTVCASIVTRCQHRWGCPQVNKFEQTSSLGHQMLAPFGGYGPQMKKSVPVGAGLVGVLYSEVQCLEWGGAGGSLYSEVPCLEEGAGLGVPVWRGPMHHT